MFLRIFSAVFLILTFFAVIPAYAGEKVIVDYVVDGDTIRIIRNGKKETVRLIGIDTPESKKKREGRQKCRQVRL